MKARIEKVLSEILSDKYDAKITIKFEEGEQIEDGDDNKTRTVRAK